jgi:hypothetical protein
VLFTFIDVKIIHILELSLDDNVKDEGAPDPRTVQFRPGRKPGIHLGRLSRYFLF